MSDVAWRKALLQARQYVSDAGSDEDPETATNSSRLLSEIDAVLQAALAPARYKLVPLEPTKEMIVAGNNSRGALGATYRAMLQAAPAHPPALPEAPVAESGEPVGRRSGHSRLKYDKATRTIISEATGETVLTLPLEAAPAAHPAPPSAEPVADGEMGERIEAALAEAFEELRQTGEGIVTAAGARHYLAQHGLAVVSLTMEMTDADHLGLWRWATDPDRDKLEYTSAYAASFVIKLINDHLTALRDLQQITRQRDQAVEDRRRLNDECDRLSAQLSAAAATRQGQIVRLMATFGMGKDDETRASINTLIDKIERGDFRKKNTSNIG